MLQWALVFSHPHNQLTSTGRLPTQRQGIYLLFYSIRTPYTNFHRGWDNLHPCQSNISVSFPSDHCHCCIVFVLSCLCFLADNILTRDKMEAQCSFDLHFPTVYVCVCVCLLDFFTVCVQLNVPFYWLDYLPFGFLYFWDVYIFAIKPEFLPFCLFVLANIPFAERKPAFAHAILGVSPCCGFSGLLESH